MNQLDYQPSQPSSFNNNPALAYTSPQAQIHNSSGGQSQSSFLPRGPQAFSQASFGGPQKQHQHNGLGGAFNSSAAGLKANPMGMLANSMSQQQQQQQQFGGDFNPASYSQPLTTTIAGGPQAQNQSNPQFHVSSPQTGAYGQISSPQGQSQIHKSPMAPPPNRHASPQTPAASQSQPQSPRSPASSAREKERLELLLDINSSLLQEMQNLQSQGNGGAPSAEIQALYKKQGHNVQLGSDAFVQVTQRVHANLGYLCGASDHALKPGSKQAPHPPNYVYPPPSMPQLSRKYSRLRALFPGWAGLDGQQAGQCRE